MYQLILAAIGLVLFAALGGTAIYYGSDAWQNGRYTAEAGRLHNDSKQILAAFWKWRYDQLADLPQGNSSIQFLVAQNYIRDPNESWLEVNRGAGAAITGWTLTPSYVTTSIGNLDPSLMTIDDCNYAVQVCIQARREVGYEGSGIAPICQGTPETIYASLQSSGFLLSCGSGDPSIDQPFWNSTVANPDDPCCVCTPAGIANTPSTAANPLCLTPPTGGG